MSYIHRSLERKFLKMSGAFKAVMVTGARQVGKSTMLKHLAQGSGRTYVSLDDADVRRLAESDPKLFFQMYRPPILIDEVQKAPELFEESKLICDANDEPIPGLWCVGSMVGDLYANCYNFRIPGQNYGACLTFGYLTGKWVME